MKLKYIIASLTAVLAFATGCQKEADHYLNEIKVDQSYVGLAQNGGSKSVALTTTGSWTASVNAKDSEWLSVSPVSGGAGSATITISATAADETRESVITIECDGKTQNINVIQQAEKTERPITPIAQVIETGAGSFRVKGTVISAPNQQYGNYNIEDETGKIYIYGTKVDGSYPKDHPNGWAAFNIEVGDVVTVEGPYSLYGSTHELVDVEIIAIEKSLIQVAAFDFTELPPTDTTFNLVIDSKVSPLLVTSDSDWLVVEDVTSDGSYVLHALENVRTAKRTANVSIKGPGAQAIATVVQAGVPATGASVSEIIDMADDSQVQTLPSTIVVALTTRGAVLSDGTKAIYAYGNTAAALKVGDGVRMSAKKTTYNGVPELTDITDVFVDSEGNTVSHPEAVDITAVAGTYEAAEAEYVKLTGTLSVSGNYYNIALDEFPEGDKQGSIVYPVDELDAKSFDGKKITVTGYYNGLSSKGKYINVIATRIAEFVDNPKGTLRNPYDASELAQLMLGGTIPEGNIYARGIINKIDNVNVSYGNAQYWLSTDGSAADLEVYRGFWYGGEKFTSEDQIKVGDEVVVYGAVKVYNGTPEFDAKNYIYTLNGKALPAGEGTAESPYNVTKAMDLVLGGETPAGTVYVKGIISQIDDVSMQYGNAQYWISDDGGKTYQLEIYRGKWFGGASFTSTDQIAVGDEVIVSGELTLYKEIVEFKANNVIVSLNGKTE
ncbi:MAG: BACON domain-containing protein [Bacteroidales bacterium]|nr:BACON domain-containing protein [Bacteroidales bacterium]